MDLLYAKKQMSKSAFLMAGFICAVLSWLSIAFIIGAVLFGSLAILFALLSKGNLYKTIFQAKVCIIMSVISMTISAVATSYNIYRIATDPVAYQEFNAQYKELTGYSIEDEIKNLEDLYAK